MRQEREAGGKPPKGDTCWAALADSSAKLERGEQQEAVLIQSLPSSAGYDAFNTSNIEILDV